MFGVRALLFYEAAQQTKPSVFWTPCLIVPNRAGEGGREARRKQAVSTTHVAAGAVAGQRFIAPVRVAFA